MTAPGRNRLRDAYCVTFFGDWEEPSGESRVSLILIVSIIIRLLALGVAVVLWRRLRDWRVGFLAVMVGLMALRQTLMLLKEPLAVPIFLDVEAHLEELPGLVVSIFVLFAIVILGRMILESKRAQELVQRSRDYAESIVDTVRAPLLVLDGELRVILAGNSFYQNFGVTPEETEGRLLFDLGDKQWDIPRLRELLKQVLPKNTKVEDFEVEHEIPTIGRRIMLLNAQRMYRRENKTQMILLTIEDITERKQAVQRLRDSEARLAERNDSQSSATGDGNWITRQYRSTPTCSRTSLERPQTRCRRRWTSIVDGFIRTTWNEWLNITRSLPKKIKTTRSTTASSAQMGRHVTFTRSASRSMTILESSSNTPERSKTPPKKRWPIKRCTKETPNCMNCKRN